MRSRLALLAIATALTVPAVAPAGAATPFDTFKATSNLTPVGAAVRTTTSNYNTDLAFSGTRAYQGSYDGFRILDVADPTEPKELKFIPCGGSQGDVLVQGNVLVRSWNGLNTTGTCNGEQVLPGFRGLHVFDVSTATAPRIVASVALPCGGSHTATAVPDLANGRLLVYNSASTAACPFFEIVSIPLANPAAASLIGLAPTGRACHDTAVILGDAMLAACAGGNGLTVLSLGGPRGGSLTSPVQLWSKAVDGVSIGHAATFSYDGEVVVFGHEPGGGSAARCQAADTVNRTAYFYKASDGTQLGEWRLPRAQTAAENCTIHNFNVVPTTDGTRLLVGGHYQSGLSVVDFTDPANATEIAYADPAPLGSTLSLGGDWGSYWHDGLIYQSDIKRGLLIWRLDHPSLATAKELGTTNPQTQTETIKAA